MPKNYIMKIAHSIFFLLLSYFTFSQKTVNETQLTKSESKLFLKQELYSGMVFNQFGNNQVKSIYQVNQGLVKGKMIEYLFDIEFKYYQDTAELNKLNFQLKTKSNELEAIIQDSINANKLAMDYLNYEIGGNEKWIALEIKNKEGKLKSKKKEILDEIVLGLEVLQAEDVTFINSQIRTPLGIASKDMNFYNLDGLRVTLKRVGLRDRDDVTGKRSREITPNEFQTNIVLKLNALRGGYLPMKGPDYVWIISGDLNTDKKRDARNPKSDRIIAKYYSVATYVKTSLIPNTLTNTMKGYIFKLNGGALVFNLADVNFNEWTRR